jgi:hypothetical protein
LWWGNKQHGALISLLVFDPGVWDLSLLYAFGLERFGVCGVMWLLGANDLFLWMI